MWPTNAFASWKRKAASQLFHEPERRLLKTVIVALLRPALAHRRPEGPEAAGEGVHGSAALPAERRRLGGEADEG